MPKRKDPSKKTGAMRMQEFGYHPVQIWLDESEWKAVKEAAEKDSRKLATWIRMVAFAVATGKQWGSSGVRRTLEDPESES